jgi:hypothetical protein
VNQRTLWGGVALSVTVAVTALLGAETGAAPKIRSARAQPKCFGASARAHAKPCENPRLRLSVVPSPRDALIEPSAPCTPVRSSQPPGRCWFGVGRSRATATVALVGDSHSVHWRAALTRVARAKRWRSISIYQTRCPYTAATTVIDGPSGPLGAACARWKHDVLQWFRQHPEVHTMFVSQNTAERVAVSRRDDMFQVKVAGYVAAWRGLPASVKRIIVIRDPPHNLNSTLGCVERAIRRRKRPGPACARPRSRALEPDAAITAAHRARSPRVRTIDLTKFMCDATRCYPVVGGVLVHKDKGHLTRTFSSTLGPYLLRRINALIAHWR